MRPKVLHVGGTLYWVIRTRNPDTQVLKDADSTPSVAVRKNGASVADSVTVTKRSATTGIYDCSYNPAGEVEGDEFTIEESATVTGTATSSATYANSWEFTVIAVERGTDGANTTTPPTAAANATAVRTELATELGRIDVATSTRLASGSYTAPPSAATVADAVWDEATVDHTSTGSFGYVIGLLFGLIENVTGWRFTTKALEQAPGGSASGSGARTVTVTVNDGTNPLQNATVRMSEGANTYVATTNSSGVATFNLDELVFTVGITKAGYQFNGDSLTVDGNETVTYSMTAISITPSNPNLVTGYYTCYSELGVVESGVTVTLQVDRVPSETGLALDSAVRTTTSDSNGLAQFTNLVPGAWYKVRRGEGNYYTFQISATATGSVELNSIIGT